MDDPEDFLDALGWGKKREPLPDPSTEAEPDMFLGAPVDGGPGCTNPDEWVQVILKRVPRADPSYVRDLVAKSDDDFLTCLMGPMGKRGQHLRDLLLEKERVSTYEIQQRYSSATRVASDLLAIGLTLKKESEKSEDGKVRTLYSLDPSGFVCAQEARQSIPGRIRVEVIGQATGCRLCGTQVEKRVFQVDHRVPFCLVGNRLAQQEGVGAFQALCPSCNTAKSHACKRCPDPKEESCRTCYWAYPEDYRHIAGKTERRLVLVARTPDELKRLGEIEAGARECGLL